MSNFTEVTLRWYTARKKHRAAKAALREYRRVQGRCPNEYQENADGETIGSCFRGLSFEGWCLVCKDSQPLWLAYRVAATDAGVALQTLNRACRALAGPRA